MELFIESTKYSKYNDSVRLGIHHVIMCVIYRSDKERNIKLYRYRRGDEQRQAQEASGVIRSIIESDSSL